MKGLSKKELLIYIVVVILSALVFHSDLFSDPAARLEMMSDRANYYHPLIFGLGIYVLIGLVRLIVIGIGKIIKR
jgi:hypothetical protein